jgi:hypothetical protein
MKVENKPSFRARFLNNYDMKSGSEEYKKRRYFLNSSCFHFVGFLLYCEAAVGAGAG